MLCTNCEADSEPLFGDGPKSMNFGHLCGKCYEYSRELRKLNDVQLQARLKELRPGADFEWKFTLFLRQYEERGLTTMPFAEAVNPMVDPVPDSVLRSST